MTKRDNGVYLRHILDSFNEIESYVKDISEKDFFENSLYQNAIIRCLEVIGEATKQLSSETRQKTPDVPWQDIAGMRDILIHQYFGVDLNEVWKTVQQDLPTLKNKISQLLN